MNRMLFRLVSANLLASVGRGVVLIGIAWYLVKLHHSGGPLGITMLLSNTLSLVAGPYIATVIDNYSRKTVLIVENAVGFGFSLLCSIWFYLDGGFTLPVLTILYVVFTFISQVHFNAQAAFVQETFRQEQYGKINSVLEVQTQIAQMLSGALAGVALLYLDFPVVLMVTSLTFFSAVLLLFAMPYTFHSRHKANTGPPSKWTQDFAEGCRFIFQNRRFASFGVAVFIPFVFVMIGNYLSPVFVDLDLNAPVTVFSTGELFYAVGAGAAGMSIVLILKKLDRFYLLAAHILVLAACVFIMVLLLQSWAFIGTYLILGWVVASTRLMSQTIFMTIVPKSIIGRVMTTLDLIALVIRVLLLALLTLLANIISARAGYMLVGSLLCIAGMTVLLTRKEISRLYTR